jgi:uncharacterized repeat protein (TIGR04138 family)
MSDKEASLWDVIDDIRANDDRYRREAFVFVIAGLNATVQELPALRREDPVQRHLSGQELLGGMVRLARHEFGEMAAVVFREWGIQRGEDIGNIVFHLVQRGQLSARPEDSIDDFRVDLDLLRALSGSDPFPLPPGPRPGRLPRRSTGPELEA